MAFDEPKLDKIFQIGILTKDLDAAKKTYEEVLGIGPWTEPHVMSGKEIDLYVNGERFYGDFMKVSFLRRYGFEIEMIQPIDPSPLKEWVDKHGSGLHHIDFHPANGDYEGFLDMCKGLTGKDTWLRGTGFGGKMDFSYVDLSEEIGCYVEVKPDRINNMNGGRPGFDY